MQCSTVQISAEQCTTVHSTAQHCSPLYCKKPQIMLTKHWRPIVMFYLCMWRVLNKYDNRPLKQIHQAGLLGLSFDDFQMVSSD